MSRIPRLFGGFRSLLTLFVIALVTALIVIPGVFNITDASGLNSKKGVYTRTESFDPRFPNYDIREDGSKEDLSTLLSYREAAKKDAAAVADIREGFVAGEAELKTRLPHAKVEYNTDIRIPEVITPDVWREKIEFLSSPTQAKRSEVLRSFLKQNNSLIGVSDAQLDDLKVTADYTNPDGNMSYAHLEQEINGVPVFRGEVKAGFTKDGQIVRVINNLAPGLDYGSLSENFGDPADAVRAAFKNVARPIKSEDTARDDSASSFTRTVFGGENYPTIADKMYFPTEPGVAVPAWRVVIWEDVASYNVIVDAETGVMLWRKNMANDQTQSATYQVYTSPNAMINSAASAAPMSPGPTDPTVGTQGALLTRNNVSFIGNEGVNSFNNLGWVTDGTNGVNGATEGNNTIAGVDLGTPNGVDAPVAGVNRVFSSAWNPPPGSPVPGDVHTTQAARDGAVIQMFYVMNLYHDELYRLGFTEQARNFQNDNFGRGGVAADRVSSEGQDSSGTNNANFNTQADGIAGRMQMFVFNGVTPNRDGTADAEIIIHEVTHGTSNRLHNNAGGLTTNMAGAMGEGWGDFYAHAMLSRSTESLDSVNATGGYVLQGGFGVLGNQNYYYGIRRFPKARISFTGGPNNRPHNPLTFADIDSLQVNTTNGAFPAMSGPHISTTADQVHAAGEVWSSALWEVRCLMVARLGWAAGNRKALQLVTDGMKLDPNGPTFLQARDAIIAAAAASPLAPEASADVLDVREGFRLRGMGFSASIQAAGSPARVTEAFDVPNAVFANPITVAENPGDGDTFPEPGETLAISVPVTNSSGSAISGVSVSITGGGTTPFGTINDGQTVTLPVSYTVPGGAACGSMHQINITGTSSVGALNPRTLDFRLGAPIGGAPASFTGAAIANPGTGTVGVAAPYPGTINVAGLTGNKVIKLELTGLNTTFPGDMDWLLVGPGGQKFVVMSDAVSAFATQSNANVVIWDGAANAMPTAGTVNLSGEWKPTDITAGDTFAAPAPAGPYNSPAPVGSATFASTFGTDGSTMNGAWSLYGVDDVSGDIATITGWKLTFEANDFTCGLASNFDISGRVVTSGGRGIGNATVTATQGGNTLVARTSSFGYFMFAQVPGSVQYTITPRAKRYTFTPQQVTPVANVSGMVFTAAP